MSVTITTPASTLRLTPLRVTDLLQGLQTSPLPPPRTRDPEVAHAPVRTHNLTTEEQRLAVRNALRYFPPSTHAELAPEFAQELAQYGHIYMYRFMPTQPLHAVPADKIPTKCRQAAAIIHMLLNNLDPAVAQFPQELVTYGGNGQVLSNWGQFRLVLHYLATMSEDQTLVLYSGHPLGLFPSSPAAPRAIITNGMVIPNYSSREEYDRMFALGVSMYGQMTAGSYCYIGPQGIVHGTTLTVLNAGRNQLGTSDLAGKVFVTAGLGGMSGAQAKAAVICGCVGVIAEVSREALEKRHKQGWVLEVVDNLAQLMAAVKSARKEKRATSIGFHGNIVDVWEEFVREYKRSGQLLVELGSDQTSCHNPFGGGYTPVQLNYEQASEMLAKDPAGFHQTVQESLRRHVAAINTLADAGMYFFDYGNAFLLEARRAGADVSKKGQAEGSTLFRYPSYVQDIMGDIFSLGFGPFRWVCTSGRPEDLATTDRLAKEVLEQQVREGVPKEIEQQICDNIKWISEAGKHEMVVGSQARILYSDQRGRTALALRFNAAIAAGEIEGTIVISRDHHDVSGTDSPFRETSNIYDGSAFTADMAVQNCIGDAFRGATWVSLHNGGGVGWGEVMNGGFGLVLDGSEAAGGRARSMLGWDVSNGVARRAWSGNDNAQATIKRAMEDQPLLRVTKAHSVEDGQLVEKLFI